VNAPRGLPDGVPVVVLVRGMGVRVRVEIAAARADQEPSGEEHDQRCDGGLGTPLQRRRQVPLEEHDRDAEDDQRERVSETPPRTELRGSLRGALAGRRDERRDRRDVVRVGRVAQPEQERDEDHDGDRAAAGEARDAIVETEHGPSLRRRVAHAVTPAGLRPAASSSGASSTTPARYEIVVPSARCTYGRVAPGLAARAPSSCSTPPRQARPSARAASSS